MSLVRYTIIWVLLMMAFTAVAQHEHHQQAAPSGSQEKESVQDSGTAHSAHMSHSLSRNLPMSRNGSGTGWHPDNTPVYAYMKHSRNWMLMLHGNLFLRANFQNFNNNYHRGEKDLDAPNWVMGMAQRPVGKKGLLSFSTMLSLDRVTMGGSGYPLLFQTGETWQGKELVNRQHPHDLVSGLSAAYTYSATKDVDLSIYTGYPGEPALGPSAFMHRISSISNPDAPLGHHWQDATHIVFGVVTGGIRYKIFKAEFSNFTGREPDENRFDFDRPRFDSYSGRLSVNPVRSISMQVSRAFIKSPEPGHPEDDVTRTTASLIHSKDFAGLTINSAFVFGSNAIDHGGIQKSFLAETNIAQGKSMVYLRFESIQKTPEELDIEDEGHHKLFNVESFTAGYSFRFMQVRSTDFNIGAQSSLNIIPVELEKYYGSYPLSAEVYLRITPSKILN